ncbi:hypothetical protein QJQ45_000370 [Haematococcus lacustris]|nr:hypothetical protein QJQ45_000370 [Haematococcus lacustris]
MGSKGVPVKQMLKEACKQFPGRVLMVNEFRTSRVSSARTNVVAGHAEGFRWLRPVRSMVTRSRIRGLMCSTSTGIRFYDRDVSAELNIRRIAAGPGRPRELSSWLGRPAMPNPGRPGQEWELMLPVHWAMQAQKRRCQGTLRDPPAGADPSQAAGAGAVAVRSSAGTAEQGPLELRQVLGRVLAACPGLLLQACTGAGRDAGLARDGLPRDALEVRLLVPRVLCASIGLAAQGQPRPLRVVMDAADKATEVDSWACPSHQVFRRLSALATKALTYFVRRADVCCLLQPDQPALTPGQPDSLPAAAAAGAPGTASAGAVALEDLLLWLSSYRDVWSRPCSASGYLMALEQNSQLPLPPLFRPFMLSRRQLLQQAADVSLVRAYHMHTAPVEELGFYDRDVSAALNIRRCAVGPGPRPTELCYWDGRPAMPKPGRPGQEWVYLPDKALLRKWRRKWQR